MLFAKSAEKIDAFKPEVANSTFNSDTEDSTEAPISTADGAE